MAYYRNCSETSESLITVLECRGKKKKKVLGELRANYKCSLLLCKSNVLFCWNVSKLPPVTLTLTLESKLCTAIEDQWFYLLWEKEPLGRDIQSPPQWQECHWSYCISQRGIDSCLSHLCGSNCKRKQGSPAPFYSVIIYYEVNFIKYLLGLGLLDVNREIHHRFKSCSFEGTKQQLKLSKHLPRGHILPPPKQPMNSYYTSRVFTVYAVRVWHTCLSKWRF